MQNLEECKLVIYSSYNNIDNGVTQEKIMVFLSNKNDKLSLVLRQSKRICHIVKSIVAVETLLLLDAPNVSFWLFKLFSESYSAKESRPITLTLSLISLKNDSIWQCGLWDTIWDFFHFTHKLCSVLDIILNHSIHFKRYHEIPW